MSFLSCTCNCHSSSPHPARSRCSFCTTTDPSRSFTPLLVPFLTMADPSLEVRPNFESNAYRVVREVLMLTHNEEVTTAIERLSTAWEDDHHVRVEAWNLQREVEDQEAECIHQERRQREEEQRQLEEAKAKKERRDAEKKKLKINDFNENRPPPSIIVPRPSQYALQKISTFDFIELWYCSPEGCSEASQVNKSQADDTLGITNANDVLTLHPVTSIRVSRNARTDHELAFSEFMWPRILSSTTSKKPRGLPNTSTP